MKDLRLVDFLMGYSERPLAMLYLVFAWSLTLKNFRLSAEAQLIAQRILTPLLLVALPVVTVLIKSFCGARGRAAADGQCVSTTPNYPSTAFSGFAEVLFCRKSRFSAAKIFYDLRPFDKMVVNSTTCTKRAKSFSRVATFAKATAAEEHVERVDL
jgi:hypothetical protein